MNWFKSLRSIAYTLVVLSFLSAFAFLFFYIKYFSSVPISVDPSDWTQTVTFVSSLITPLASLLSVLLILHINAISQSLTENRNEVDKAKLRSDMLATDLELLDKVSNDFNSFSYYNLTLESQQLFEIPNSIKSISRRRKPIIHQWSKDGFDQGLRNFEGAILGMVHSYDEHLEIVNQFRPGELFSLEQRDQLRIVRGQFHTWKGTATIFLRSFYDTVYDEYKTALMKCASYS